MPSLQKFCDAMRWAADSDRVGYSQSDRESLQEWKFFTGEDTNTDCSKLTIEALQYAGFPTGWATYTGNMSAALCANGWERLPVDGNPRKGDILLSDAHHVAVWLGDCLAQASIGEGGLVSGGARGDQTGWEVNTRSYYDYPWDCYLRYAGESEDDMTPEQAAQLKFVFQHMCWDDSTHYSDMGNLVAEMPITYPTVDAKGKEVKHTAALGARIGYIDQRMHAIEANQAAMMKKLDAIAKKL